MDKIDLVIQRIDDLKDSNDQRLDSIDTNLSDHMEQTKLVKQLTIDNQVRIQVLEEPKVALKVGKSVLLYIGLISGTILGLLKVIDLIGK